jgi:hypothetical protein
MSRKRGRPGRQYRLRVGTVRRDPIDFDALARAALEQAAMDQQNKTNRCPRVRKDRRHDRLA